MDFHAFTERVKASAAKAADAVGNLQTFDDMAAKDDYIHSEGLNVGQGSSSNNNNSNSTAKRKKQPPLPGRPVMRKASAATETVNGVFSMVESIAREKAEPIFPSQQQQQQQQQQQYGMNDEDDDDDDEEDDPILRMIRITKKPTSQTTATPTQPSSSFTTPFSIEPSSKQQKPHHRQDESSLQQQHVVNNDNIPKKKNPNRFMEDLDKRVSMAEQGVDMVVVEEEEEENRDGKRPSRLDATPPPWNGWVQQLATSPVGQFLANNIKTTPQQQQQQKEQQQQQQQHRLLGPLSRKTDHHNRFEKEDDNVDNYQNVVSSSAVLGDDEFAELERMRRRTNQANALTAVLNLIRQNPHHSFIGLTLVLAIMAYYYSRHRGSEDDVTRL